MKFPAKASVDFELAPAGNHVAICNAIIDLGLQPGRGMYPDPKHEVFVRFELPTEPVRYLKDGVEVSGPMNIGRRFTASMSEKANLRKFIESWFGKKFPSDDAASDFELRNLLGRKCLLNVTHNEKGSKTFANLANATPIPKGMQADYPQHNPSIYYSLDEHNQRDYDALPKWAKDALSKRIQEPQRKSSSDDVGPPPDDGAPFNDDIPW